MKIAIARTDNENITTIKDYSDIRDCGEVAHVICELESIRQDLLDIWREMENDS